MSVRRRPVITVVSARPMDEVGFRDVSAATSVSPEAPKAVPQMPKNPPVARPLPPANNNKTAFEPNSMPVVHQRPVPADRKPTALIGSLDLDDQTKKFPSHAPPKPRRTNPVRPITMHFDGQNNVITSEQKSIPEKPILTKRPSVPTDCLSDDSDSRNSQVNTSDSWKRNDWVLEDSSVRSKPEAAPRRPTIIRASSYQSKSGGSNIPPPVAPKSADGKQHAAELMQVSEVKDATIINDNCARAAAKPKPTVKPKPESKSEVGETESKSEQPPNVRKRPTVIRPTLDKCTNLSEKVASENTASSGNDDEVQSSVRPKVAPTIIHPGFSGRASSGSHLKTSLDQDEAVCNRSEVSARSLEKASPIENTANEQPKQRPNIIRPNVEARRKDHLAEGSVAISGDRSIVHFSATETRVQQEEQRGSTSVDVSERQNAENWKRVEMEESQSKAPARPVVPPALEPVKKPPSKPPPPRSSKLIAQGPSDIPNDISPPGDEILSRQGPPPRPTVGPTKANKSTQPSKKDQHLGLQPSLPTRPMLGHPLFHYVVTGPHAIALFEYNSAQVDELSFKAGEVIVLEKWINSDWLYGRTAQASGMFPATFVDIIQQPPRDLTESQAIPASDSKSKFEYGLTAPLPGSGPRCLARFDYNGEDPSDLAFVEGDIIQILERVGEEWMKGELNQRKGIFPVSFVEIIEDLPIVEEKFVSSSLKSDQSPVLKDFPNQQPGELNLLIEERPHCIALYDFPAQNLDDLSFSAGDKIILLDKINDDWLNGQIHDKTGIFPSSFVRIVRDIDCHGNSPESQHVPVDQVPSVELVELVEASKPDTVAHTISPEMSSKAAKTAVAVYDFSGETSDDLTFHIGDVIEIIRTVNEDWMEGKVNDKSGIFPSAFVKLSE